MKRLIVPAILAAFALPALAQAATPAADPRPASQQQRQAAQKGCADKARSKQNRKTHQDNQKTPKAS